MSATSSIEWTDATWNPVRGCTKISPGCAHCYAEVFAERWRGVAGHPYESGFDPRIAPEKLREPTKWKKPKRIFVNSMSDLFHHIVSDDYIDDVVDVMREAHWHTYQVLTKRAERMADDFERRNDSHLWPLPNVWLGVSVENQKYADERIPHLLATPAAVRFLSVEPLLGPVDLSAFFGGEYATIEGSNPNYNFGIDWVIVGGESGPGARPMHPSWVRSIRDQCTSAGVPFFFKQWGEWAPLDEPFEYRPAIGSGNREYVRALRAFEREHGASKVIDDRPEGWDRVMVDDGTCITDGERAIGRVGKKAAGRVLDGRTWDEMPEVAQR